MLTINSTLCWCRLGYTIEKIPACWFHLSEDKSHQVVLSVASSWNFAVTVLKSLAEGNNLVLFLKVCNYVMLHRMLYFFSTMLIAAKYLGLYTII